MELFWNIILNSSKYCVFVDSHFNYIQIIICRVTDQPIPESKNDSLCIISPVRGIENQRKKPKRFPLLLLSFAKFSSVKENVLTYYFDEKQIVYLQE